jgi:hypothetical protein
VTSRQHCLPSETRARRPHAGHGGLQGWAMWAGRGSSPGAAACAATLPRDTFRGGASRAFVRLLVR